MTQAQRAYTVQVPSHTAPNTTYTVTFHPAGATCTCVGFGYRGMCSHITEAAAKVGQFTKTALQAHNEQATLAQQARRCTTCGTELSGTHAMLDTCARCYLNQATMWLRTRTRPTLQV